MEQHNVTFKIDSDNRSMIIDATYNAGVSTVWDMYMKSELLDKWWAPLPFRAENKKMDFHERGNWFYKMVGPEVAVHYCVADFVSIEKYSFSAADSFADEKGNKNSDLPTTAWMMILTDHKGQTHLKLDRKLATAEDIETLIKMGFKEGFGAAQENLRKLLKNE